MISGGSPGTLDVIGNPVVALKRSSAKPALRRNALSMYSNGSCASATRSSPASSRRTSARRTPFPLPWIRRTSRKPRLAASSR